MSVTARARVVELRHGRVGTLHHAGTLEPSAIGKARAIGPVHLGSLGFDGDAVGDTVHHGGPDKAACVYAEARYGAWRSRYGADLPRPAFGENLLLAGTDEERTCVGDVYALGGAVVQVSQPRVPCYKPAAFTGERRLTVDLRTTGWTGWYLRVIEPGVVAEGDAARLLERSDGAVSVARLNALRYGDEIDVDGLLTAAAAPGLMPAWRDALTRRATGRGTSDDD